MSTLRLYIWEGRGISSAYHDDGTLVVLAESPEQAREVVAQTRAEYEAAMAATEPQRKAHYARERKAATAAGGYGPKFWATDIGRQLLADRDPITPPAAPLPDGGEHCMDREPDQVIEIDRPTIVAFNGGGYD